MLKDLLSNRDALAFFLCSKACPILCRTFSLFYRECHPCRLVQIGTNFAISFRVTSLSVAM